MTPKRWIVALVALVVVVAAVLGGSAIYAAIENSKAPDALSLSTPSAGSSATPLAAADLAGTWTVGSGSQAGYRVKEVLNGQDVTVVGRTSGVTGTATIDGTSLSAADVTVDMTSLTTDNSSRDGQFQSILSTAEHPTATFALTAPVDISGVTDGVVPVEAAGTLTINGVSQPVTASLQAQSTTAGVEVTGQIPVTFADYGVTAPDLAFVKVEPTGTVELLLTLTR